MRKRERVELVEYNPEWPKMFDRERALIAVALGSVILDIQHVGSTSIPALAAKPIIDIMIAVESLQQIKNSVPVLKELDYEYCGEAGIPGRLFFRKYVTGKRTFHLHCVEPHSDVWHQYVPFRNYLIAHPDIAREYEALKYDLAIKYEHDRVRYTESKDEFIKGILRKVLSGNKKG